MVWFGIHHDFNVVVSNWYKYLGHYKFNMNIMDNFLEDEIGFIEDKEDFFNIGGDKRPDVLRRYHDRYNHMELSIREYYTRFHFSKDSNENRLVPLLYPDGERAEDNSGLPFTSTQVFYCIIIIIVCPHYNIYLCFMSLKTFFKTFYYDIFILVLAITSS